MWGAYLLTPTFSKNDARCAPAFLEKPASKRYPPYPLTKTREFSFFHFPPQRGGIGIWEKCIFPESPIFPPQFLLPAKIRRSFRGIKMREK
jgi:hypothetical protein